MKSSFAGRLSARARQLADLAPLHLGDEPLPEGLTDYLASHLEQGETHYTTRPGMIALRRAIDDLLSALGVPARGESGVVVTASEGESMFVTLLGLGLTAGSVIVTDSNSHLDLFEIMGIKAEPPGSTDMASAAATFVDFSAGGSKSIMNNIGQPIIGLGSSLTSSNVIPECGPNAIVIGDLHQLRQLVHFRVGFVSAPQEVAKRIMTWKQALSICTAAPSQRAALFHLNRDGE